MTIVAVNGGGNTPQGDMNGDVGQSDVLVGVSGRDWKLDFGPELTAEPMAPQTGGGHEDWIIVESWQFADDPGADGDYLLTAIQHWATEESQIGQTVTFTATVHVDPYLI
jgi:hypothetical protein